MEYFDEQEVFGLINTLLDFEGREIPIKERDETIHRFISMMCPEAIEVRELQKKYEESDSFAYHELEKHNKHVNKDHDGDPLACKAFESSCPIIGSLSKENLKINI